MAFFFAYFKELNCYHSPAALEGVPAGWLSFLIILDLAFREQILSRQWFPLASTFSSTLECINSDIFR
jgi:hypothetical protein